VGEVGFIAEEPEVDDGRASGEFLGNELRELLFGSFFLFTPKGLAAVFGPFGTSPKGFVAPLLPVLSAAALEVAIGLEVWDEVSEVPVAAETAGAFGADL
jgi:hypothetical protein